MQWSFLKEVAFPQLELDDEDLRIIEELAEKLQDNYPYHLPEYAGQMIKPPHPLAQAAHWLTSFVNPNNHALDGGRATSALELEVVEQLAFMVGFEHYLGHLTSGGTTANLEALWVARQHQPGTVVLANEHAHYTHSRMSEVLGLPFEAVPSTGDGTMDLRALENRLHDLQERGLHATVVATLGTTGMGAVDPLHELLPVARRFGARVHVDAAYGGYFRLTTMGGAADEAMRAMAEADSIVIDPHKHGLQPYGCGAVLFNDPKVGIYYKHDSPYTYFTSDQLHLGEITLECSRAGAAAAGVWATLKKFPLVAGGAMAERLQNSLLAARGLAEHLKSNGFWALDPTMDIVLFSLAGTTASEVSQRNRAFFESKAAQGIHLALFKLPEKNCPWPLEWDTRELVVVRSVLMKPEHNDPELWEAIAVMD